MMYACTLCFSYSRYLSDSHFVTRSPLHMRFERTAYNSGKSRSFCCDELSLKSQSQHVDAHHVMSFFLLLFFSECVVTYIYIYLYIHICIYICVYNVYKNFSHTQRQHFKCFFDRINCVAALQDHAQSQVHTIFPAFSAYLS